MNLASKKIAELRALTGKSQKETAEEMQCSQTGYSGWETGNRDISTEMLVKIAKHYKVSTDYLLGLTDKEKPYPLAKGD